MMGCRLSGSGPVSEVPFKSKRVAVRIARSGTLEVDRLTNGSCVGTASIGFWAMVEGVHPMSKAPAQVRSAEEYEQIPREEHHGTSSDEVSLPTSCKVAVLLELPAQKRLCYWRSWKLCSLTQRTAPADWSNDTLISHRPVRLTRAALVTWSASSAADGSHFRKYTFPLRQMQSSRRTLLC